MEKAHALLGEARPALSQHLRVADVVAVWLREKVKLASYEWVKGLSR